MGGLSCGRKRNLGRRLFNRRTGGHQLVDIRLKDLGRRYCAGLGIGGGGGGIGSHSMVPRILSPFRVKSLYQASALPVHPFPSRCLMTGALPSQRGTMADVMGRDGAWAS